MNTDEAWESFIGIRKSSAQGYRDTVAAALNKIETDTANLTKLTNQLLGDQGMLEDSAGSAMASSPTDDLSGPQDIGGKEMAQEDINEDRNALDEALGVIDQQVGASPDEGGAVPPAPAEGGPEEGVEATVDVQEGMGVPMDGGLPKPEANFATECIQFSEKIKKELQNVANQGDYYKARRLIEIITAIDKIIDSDNDPGTVLKSDSMEKAKSKSENDPVMFNDESWAVTDDMKFGEQDADTDELMMLNARHTPASRAAQQGGQRREHPGDKQEKMREDAYRRATKLDSDVAGAKRTPVPRAVMQGMKRMSDLAGGERLPTYYDVDQEVSRAPSERFSGEEGIRKSEDDPEEERNASRTPNGRARAITREEHYGIEPYSSDMSRAPTAEDKFNHIQSIVDSVKSDALGNELQGTYASAAAKTPKGRSIDQVVEGNAPNRGAYTTIEGYDPDDATDYDTYAGYEALQKSNDGQTADPIKMGSADSNEGGRRSMPMPKVDMEKDGVDAQGTGGMSGSEGDTQVATSDSTETIAESCSGAVKKSIPSIRELMAHRQGGEADPYMEFAKAHKQNLQYDIEHDTAFQKSTSEKPAPFSDLMAKYRKVE